MEINTFPAIISCPGKYYISQDVIFSSTSNTITNLITVNSCNVTIDLMGHTLSISDNYRYKNRWFNLIYSKHAINVNNGTLGMTSGYSIICDSDVHCNGITFSLYELGAIYTDSYISLDSCTILSPNSTNTTYTYDYSRRLIISTFNMISDNANALPITVIGQLSQYIATLENLLDFVLEQSYQGIYDIRFFNANITSYRSEYILYASKTKLCNTNISIPSINTTIYNMERLTNISTNSIILDVGSFPVQYNSSVTIPELSNVVWYSSSIVNTYNLQYYRMPQEIIDAIKNLQTSIPNGYSNVNIINNIIIVWSNDIKFYESTITIPNNVISILINNSRYVRCINCTIGGIFKIISSKSIRITSSTIMQLEILSSSCLELCNNIITLLILHNVSPSNNTLNCIKIK